MEWLSQNKEWFFPFIGTILGAIIASVTSIFIAKKSQKKLRSITQTTIEYGRVNIKVDGEEDENGRALVKLRYLGSSLVDAPQRPVRYQDIVNTRSGKDQKFTPEILAQEFKPEATILNKEDFERYSNCLKYELIGPKNEPLSFVGKIEATRELHRKQGFIGLHIPYYVRYMVVQIDISEAKFIKDYNGESQLKNTSINNATIMQTFNELSMTYTIIVINAPGNSDLVFAWKNDEVQ